MSKDPDIDDIVKSMAAEGESHTKEEITAALEAIIEPISLFEPVYNDGSSDSIYVLDQLSDDNNTDESWLEDIALKEAMKKLGERERSIINMRFFKGKTQMEIADEIGISDDKMLQFTFARGRAPDVTYMVEAGFVT